MKAWYETNYRPGHGPRFVFVENTEMKEGWKKVEDAGIAEVSPSVVQERVDEGEVWFSPEATAFLKKAVESHFHGTYECRTDIYLLFAIVNSNSWYGWEGTIAFLYRNGLSPREHIVRGEKGDGTVDKWLGAVGKKK